MDNKISNKDNIELLETIEIPVAKIKTLLDIPEEEIELLETIQIPIEDIKEAKNKENEHLTDTIKIPVEDIINASQEIKELEKNKEIEVPKKQIKDIFAKAKKKYFFIGKKKICKKIWLVIFIISIIIIVLSLVSLISWQKDNDSSKKEIEKIQSLTIVEEIKPTPLPTPSPTPTPLLTPEPTTLPELLPTPTPTPEANPYWDFIYIPYIQVNLDKLKEENSDTIGWIKVNNTNINYPFVQTTDNEYYLKHSFYRRSNSAGWVFLDYRNNFQELDKNNILYAHGRLNNTMFGSLKKVVDKKWYQNPDNKYIQISSLYANTTWEVFSTYTILPESYYLKTKFQTDEEFITFYEELKKRSVYPFEVELTKDDKILTLSSCYNDELRVVLHAKLVAINPK